MASTTFNPAKIAKTLVGGKITINDALALIEQVVVLIDIAEDIYENLKGDEKLRAVVDGALGMIRCALPDETEDNLKALRKKLAPIVSLLVTLFRARGMLSPAKAQG